VPDAGLGSLAAVAAPRSAAATKAIEAIPFEAFEWEDNDNRFAPYDWFCNFIELCKTKQLDDASALLILRMQVPDDFRQDTLLKPEFLGPDNAAGETWGAFWKRLGTAFVEWYTPQEDSAEATMRLLGTRMRYDETMDEYFDRFEAVRMQGDARIADQERRTSFLYTLPKDMHKAYQAAMINTPTDGLTWSRFREIICKLWWIHHSDDPRFERSRARRGLARRSGHSSSSSDAGGDLLRGLATALLNGNSNGHSNGKSKASRRSKRKGTLSQVRDEDEETDDDDLEEGDEIPNEADERSRGGLRRKNSTNGYADVSKIAKKVAKEAAKTALAEAASQGMGVQVAKLSADAARNALRLEKKTAEAEAKYDAVTGRVAEAELAAKTAEAEAAVARQRLNQLHAAQTRARAGAGAPHVAVAAAFEEPMTGLGGFSSHVMQGPSAAAPWQTPYQPPLDPTAYSPSLHGHAPLGVPTPYPHAFPPQHATPPSPYAHQPPTFMSQQQPYSTPPPLQGPGPQYFPQQQPSGLGRFTPGRPNRPWEIRWCAHCEVASHNTQDCRSTHLPQGFIRERGERRARGDYSDGPPPPRRGPPYRQAEGADARREQQQQQWNQRGPAAPQGAWNNQYPNNTIGAASSNSQVHMDQLLQRLATLERAQGSGQAGTSAGAGAGAGFASAAPTTASGQVHPDRVQQRVHFHSVQVIQAHFPSHEQASQYHAAFGVPGARGAMPVIPPHLQYDSRGRGLLMMPVLVNKQLTQDVLIDSGANLSLVDERLLRRLNPSPAVHLMSTPLRVGHAGNGVFELREYCILEVTASENSRELTVPLLFYVRRMGGGDSGSTPQLILGQDGVHRILQTYNYVTGEITLNFDSTHRVTAELQPAVTPRFFPGLHGPTKSWTVPNRHWTSVTSALTVLEQDQYLRSMCDSGQAPTLDAARARYTADPGRLRRAQTDIWAVPPLPPLVRTNAPLRGVLRHRDPPDSSATTPSSLSRASTAEPTSSPILELVSGSKRKAASEADTEMEVCSDSGGAVPSSPGPEQSGSKGGIRPNAVGEPIRVQKGKPIPAYSQRLVAVEVQLPLRPSTATSSDTSTQGDPRYSDHYLCEPSLIYSTGARGRRSSHAGHVLPLVWTAALCDQRTGRPAGKEDTRRRILYLRVYNESAVTVSLTQGTVLGHTVPCASLDAFQRLVEPLLDGGEPQSAATGASTAGVPLRSASHPGDPQACVNSAVAASATPARAVRESYVPDMQMTLRRFTDILDPSALQGRYRFQPLKQPVCMQINSAAGAGDADTYTHTTSASAAAAAPAAGVEDAEITEEQRLAQLLEAVKIGPALSDTQKRQLRQLVAKHREVFAENPLCPPAIPGIYHRIDTGNAKPIYSKPYPMSPQRRRRLGELIDALLKAGLIERSNSPWASPSMLVEKQDSTGPPRLVCDYRGLNSVTTRNATPIARVDDVLAKCRNAVYNSTIDLAAGFHQIQMHPDSVDKTAFVTPDGLFHWRRMPMGIMNGPAEFHRYVASCFVDMGADGVLVYFDDILVFTDTWEKHLALLDKVFTRMKASFLSGKATKCKFGFKEVKFLGHLISDGTIRPLPDRVKAVAEMPAPVNAAELRSFLGMAQYYKDHVPNFANFAYPLFGLLKKNTPWEWTTARQAAFDNLKKALLGSKVLYCPNHDLPFIVHTDASQHGIGGVLCQEFVSGEHPIAFYSRQLNATEQRYHTTHRELLAIVECVKKWRIFLADQPFTIYTDHQPLVGLLTKKDITDTRTMRWVYALQEFTFTLKYRPGAKNQNADALSRLPAPGTAPASSAPSPTVLSLRSQPDNILTFSRRHGVQGLGLGAIRGPLTFTTHSDATSEPKELTEEQIALFLPSSTCVTPPRGWARQVQEAGARQTNDVRPATQMQAVLELRRALSNLPSFEQHGPFLVDAVKQLLALVYMRYHFPGFRPLQQVEVLMQMLLNLYLCVDAVIRHSHRLTAGKVQPFAPEKYTPADRASLKGLSDVVLTLAWRSTYNLPHAAALRLILEEVGKVELILARVHLGASDRIETQMAALLTCYHERHRYSVQARATEHELGASSTQKDGGRVIETLSRSIDQGLSNAEPFAGSHSLKEAITKLFMLCLGLSADVRNLDELRVQEQSYNELYSWISRHHKMPWDEMWNFARQSQPPLFSREEFTQMQQRVDRNFYLLFVYGCGHPKPFEFQQEGQKRELKSSLTSQRLLIPGAEAFEHLCAFLQQASSDYRRLTQSLSLDAATRLRFVPEWIDGRHQAILLDFERRNNSIQLQTDSEEHRPDYSRFLLGLYHYGRVVDACGDHELHAAAVAFLAHFIEFQHEWNLLDQPPPQEALRLTSAANLGGMPLRSLSAMVNRFGEDSQRYAAINQYRCMTLKEIRAHHREVEGAVKEVVPSNSQLTTDLVMTVWADDVELVPDLTRESPEAKEFIRQQNLEWGDLYDYHKSGTRPLRLNAKETQQFVERAEHYTLDNDVLYFLRMPRSKNSHRAYDPSTVHKCLCVPSSYRPLILANAHDSAFGGHMGTHRTFSTIYARYFWPGLYKDVEDYVRTCPLCQTRKVARNPSAIPAMSMSVPSRPFERIAVDILGPLPPGPKNEKYLLVFVDYFTRYAIVEPLETISAAVVADVIVKSIICKHGRPDYLLSDRGSQFLSALVSELLSLLGTLKLNTTAYHPQTNGLVERFNGTIVDIISTLFNLADPADSWVKYAQPACFAYNTSIQATLEESPYYILYGRDPVLPGEALLAYTGEHFRSTTDYINELQHTLSLCWSFVKGQLDDARNKYLAKNTNLKYLPSYRPGDRVWLLIPSKALKTSSTAKFVHPWIGPFEVIERRSPVTYRIKRLSGNTATQVVNITRLKPVIARPGESEQIVFNSPLASDLQADDAARIGAELGLPTTTAERTQTQASSPPQPLPSTADSSSNASSSAATDPRPGAKRVRLAGPTSDAPHTRQRTTGRAATYTGMAAPDPADMPKRKRPSKKKKTQFPTAPLASTALALYMTRPPAPPTNRRTFAKPSQHQPF
jgi:hypothetical protein